LRGQINFKKFLFLIKKEEKVKSFICSVEQ
jgi:hypothetical protein